MPELPEVESVARSLRPRLVGRRVIAIDASGLALRRPIDLKGMRAALEGAEVTTVRRVGKYLLIAFSSQQVLLAHLGMSGRLVFAPTDEPRRPHTHALFTLDGGLDLRYVDPRRFGVLAVYAAEALAASRELSVLGVDPLEAGFTIDYLQRELAGARRDLKGFLLDQGRIAGLGNIYACEAMFLAGLAPRRRTHRLGRARALKLHHAIQKVLKQSIANRGTSFSDYVDAEGEAGSNQDALWVYGREGLACHKCKSLIKRVVQSARSTFHCPGCQR